MGSRRPDIDRVSDEAYEQLAKASRSGLVEDAALSQLNSNKVSIAGALVRLKAGHGTSRPDAEPSSKLALPPESGSTKEQASGAAPAPTDDTGFEDVDSDGLSKDGAFAYESMMMASMEDAPDACESTAAVAPSEDEVEAPTRRPSTKSANENARVYESNLMGSRMRHTHAVLLHSSSSDDDGEVLDAVNPHRPFSRVRRNTRSFVRDDYLDFSVQRKRGLLARRPRLFGWLRKGKR